MAHLIDKDALIAMIRNKVDSYKGDGIISIGVLKQHCEDFIISLDTLEVTEVQEESVSEELDEAADNAFNKVLNTHEIVNIRSCLEMFKYGAQWKEQQFEKNRLAACDAQKEAESEIDNELTWEDIHAIAIIEDKLIHELCLNDQTLPHTQEFYEEVLKRFKTKKEESC